MLGQQGHLPTAQLARLIHPCQIITCGSLTTTIRAAADSATHPQVLQAELLRISTHPTPRGCPVSNLRFHPVTRSGVGPIVDMHPSVQLPRGWKYVSQIARNTVMKNQVRSLLIGTALTLATCSLSHGMSTFITFSATPLWPTSSTPDNNLVYNVTTVGRGGSGLLEVALTAGDMPPGVTVTFSPDVLRFTGNQLTTQTATMTVHCPSLIPLDCFPFTLTGTALRESITITNLVMFTPEYVAIRPPTLYLDDLGSSSLRLRGLGATGKTYQIEAAEDIVNPVWMPLGTATADGNGRFTYFTAQLASGAPRFYRAVETTP